MMRLLPNFEISGSTAANGGQFSKLINKFIGYIEYIFQYFDLAKFVDSIEVVGTILAVALTAPAYEFIRRYFQRYEIFGKIVVAPSTENKQEWIVDIKNKSQNLFDLNLLILNENYRWTKNCKVLRRSRIQDCRNLKIRSNELNIIGIFPQKAIKIKVFTDNSVMLNFFSENKKIKFDTIKDYSRVKEIPEEWNKIVANLAF